ncbi:MAG: hypothetical protein J7493_04945 [Porphyrobacter sp.]|nr:hypothetical protein [Porphyrobacter sp.]
MSYLGHSNYGIALAMLAALKHDGKAFCSTFKVGTTHESRKIHGLRIYGGRLRTPRAVLIVGGAHAREMIPPESVLLFAWKICRSYANGNDITFGGKTYPASIVALLVESLEIIVVPLANPDGRAWVETADQNWRKNRRPPPAPGGCRGADTNRNYDFLFSSGLGTSTSPCAYEVYRGPNAQSEPEVKALRDLIDRQPNIRGVLDVHSYTGLILYPWGDDQNQSTNAAMSFLNPTFDGLRGIKGDNYREHILSSDWKWYQETAARMRDGAHEVAQRTYVPTQGIDLYATSGTLSDYAYSRHLAEQAFPKILGMAVEIGFASDGQFRPTGNAAKVVRDEGVVLIIEFCLAMICTGDAVLSSSRAARKFSDELRSLRAELKESPAGQRYVEWSTSLAGRILVSLADPHVAKELPGLVKEFRAWWNAKNQPLSDEAAKLAGDFLATLRKRGPAELAPAIDAFMADIERMTGNPASKAIRTIRAKPKSARTTS